MTRDRRSGPEELSVTDAVHRYLSRLRRDKSDSTVDTYRLDLRQFVKWCDQEGIERVDELTGYDFELYEADRSHLAPMSLKNQMGIVKRFTEFCEDIEAVEDGLHKKVHVPQVSIQDQSRDDKLSTEAAVRLLRHFRDRDNGLFGSKWHTALEIAWHTGARIGGLRALDLDDYDREFHVLEFRHRPKTETPLKNKMDGERDVAILPAVADALDEYISKHRVNRHDEHNRAPLFTSRSSAGRPVNNTIRGWLYQATQPCWYTDPCPHERERGNCEWTIQTKASQCPSSRSPHAIRTGAITFHQDRGFDPQDTSARVNASLRTIKRHYDKATRRDEMENRRRPQLGKLELEEEDRSDD